MPFLKLKKSLPFLSLLNFFFLTMKRYWIFYRCFFCVCRNNHISLPFIFGILHWLLNVKSTLDSWDKSQSIMIYYPLICWLCQDFIEGVCISIPSRTHISIRWWIWYCPKGLQSSVNFSLFFSLFVLYVISIDIFSTLLILSSVRSDLLLNPSSEFPISFILLSYSIGCFILLFYSYFLLACFK